MENHEIAPQLDKEVSAQQPLVNEGAESLPRVFEIAFDLMAFRNGGCPEPTTPTSEYFKHFSPNYPWSVPLDPRADCPVPESDTDLFPIPILPRGLREKFKFDYCVFCKKNGEDEMLYNSHTLKNDNGHITCPVLYKYQCPCCGASGPAAHTIKYCKLNRTFRTFYRHQSVRNHIHVNMQRDFRAGSRFSNNVFVDDYRLDQEPFYLRGGRNHFGGSRMFN